MKFTDHFSSQSSDYSLYRPDYPPALFKYLSSLSPSTELAWDCATGNGQAASCLASYFKKVIATDISAAQIHKAQAVHNIDYRVASAEHSGIDSGCIDLIMVAQALHWFDFDNFYREARRVLTAEGILAVVSYQLPRITTEIDTIIDMFHRDIIGRYWPAERCHVDTAYINIPFPLEEITPPLLQIEHDWTLDQFLGYLRSWSAVIYFEKDQRQNPVDFIKEDLATLWPAAALKRICWPLTVRTGKFNRKSI